jgi:hypothetical protein
VDYTLALRFSAVMLTVLCLLLATLIGRRDPLPLESKIRIDTLPRARWPAILTRAGIVCLLGSFVLLLMACCTLLD